MMMQRSRVRMLVLTNSMIRRPVLAIEGGGRLIEDEQFGLADDRPRDGHALLLAARELDRHDVRAMGQADDLELAARPDDRPRPGLMLEDQGYGDVLGRGQAREQVEVLEHETDGAEAEGRKAVSVQGPDILARDGDLAGVRPQDAREHAQQRGLAAPGRADDVQHLAVAGDEIHLVHRHHLGVAGSEPFRQPGGDDRRRRCCGDVAHGRTVATRPCSWKPWPRIAVCASRCLDPPTPALPFLGWPAVGRRYEGAYVR